MTLHLYGKRRITGTLQVDASYVRLECLAEIPAFIRPRVEERIKLEVARLLPRVSPY